MTVCRRFFAYYDTAVKITVNLEIGNDYFVFCLDFVVLQLQQFFTNFHRQLGNYTLLWCDAMPP